MRLFKEALGVLGALVVVAVIVAFIAPRRAHALVAALVQIVPGTTTHVGQNESQLVSLVCGGFFCSAIDPDGNFSGAAYSVPAGYTLIVTDYQWIAFGTGVEAGVFHPDYFYNTATGNLLGFSQAIADNLAEIYAHEHYASGIRVGSGVTIADHDAASFGDAFIQGYLVPND